jgi:antitoxin HicB
MTQADYPMCVRVLTADQGGGYLVEFPDLPGCMSDGETVADALANAAEAQAAWLAAMREAGRAIPAPGADPSEG